MSKHLRSSIVWPTGYAIREGLTQPRYIRASTAQAFSIYL